MADHRVRDSSNTTNGGISFVRIRRVPTRIALFRQMHWQIKTKHDAILSRNYFYGTLHEKST